MNQKIWVIPETDLMKSPAKRRVENRKNENFQEKIQTQKQSSPKHSQKSPALSFSFSMFIWGSGQMYTRNYGAGSMFMAFMLFFYTAISFLVLSPASVNRFISEIDVPLSILLVAFGIFFVAGLALWLCNAVDAYYRATRSTTEPFLGVDNELWPLLCSFLFPGWGQFLNGQPRKGLFFSLFGLMGISSISVLLVARNVWPLLQTSYDRAVFEIYLAAAISAIPISITIWIVSIYDSFRSCREPFGKKPGLPYAGTRVRRQGIAQGLLPRGTVILGLLLAISVGMQSIPRNFYLESLERIRLEMLGNNMELVPQLIGKVVDFIDR